MKRAEPFANSSVADIQRALDGGTLVLYSVARPASPDRKVERSGVLATFTFESTPALAANPVLATGVGTPGFARAFTATGAPVADFSAGAGDAEVKLSEVSTTAGFTVSLTRLSF